MTIEKCWAVLATVAFLATCASAQSDYSQSQQGYSQYGQQQQYVQQPQNGVNQNYNGQAYYGQYNQQGYANPPPPNGYYQQPYPQQQYNQQPYPQQQYNQQPYPQQQYSQQPYPQQQYNQQSQQQQPLQQEPQAAEPSPKSEKNPGKSLQSLHASMPFENERWKIGDGHTDFSSLGIEFNWTRLRVKPNGYSSVFGIGLGYNSGEIDNGFDVDGIDFNLRFGWGIAPVQGDGDLILAIHFIFGLDVKMLDEASEGYECSATYVDLMLGGDFILAYALSESFGVLAGADITTNVLGLGVLSVDSPKTDDSWLISYQFSGINIVPRLGIYFIF